MRLNRWYNRCNSLLNLHCPSIFLRTLTSHAPRRQRPIFKVKSAITGMEQLRKNNHSRQSSSCSSPRPVCPTTENQSIPLTEVRGQSGKLYTVERVLQARGPVMGRVLVATAAEEKYILKEVPAHNYAFRSEIYERLGEHDHIRALEDTAPDQSIFIFRYFKENLLGLIQKDSPLSKVKKILHQALQGLAAIHAQHIVHNDVKPNNILIQTSGDAQDLIIDQTVIADLEDSAYCPPPGHLQGAQLGNWMWRSPEAHAEGPMNTPSDVFAFAAVCIYTMTKRVIFGVLEESLAEGEEVLAVVLERQLSYFGDPDAFNSFIEYLHSVKPDNPWIGIFSVIRSGFSVDNPREPFALWELSLPCDETFRDLILKMTHFDPRCRVTAQEALQHAWFEGV